GGDVVLAEPPGRFDAGSGRRERVPDPVTVVEERLDLAGADQQEVPGGDVGAGELGRGVEVVGGDRVARGQAVVAEGAGDVEQHARADERPDLVDPAAGGALGGDRRRGEPVVDVTAVA